MWNDQSAVTGTGREGSNGRNDSAHWRADPVVLVSPILNQGVNTTATGRSKFRVEPWQLGVVISCEAVNGVWTPFSIDNSEHGWVDGPIIFVDEPAQKIRFFIKRPGDPLRVKNDAVRKTKIENAHGQRLEMRLGTSDINYSGSTLVIRENLDSFVSQLSNIRKQDIINSFQFAKRGALTNIFGCLHAANDGAVEGG